MPSLYNVPQSNTTKSQLAPSHRYGGAPNPWRADAAYDRTGQPNRTVSDRNGPAMANGVPVGARTRDDMFIDWFGIPNTPTQPGLYDNYGQENLDLPDAFIGANPYLADLLCSTITKETILPVTLLFPFKEKEDGLEISWRRLIFDDHMLGITPHESVSRLTTSRKEGGNASMLRRGIAMLLEHGFMNTPAGREYYRFHLEQMKFAVGQTAAYEAMFNALNHPLYDDSSRRSNYGRANFSIETSLRDEISEWGRVQKDEHGWKHVFSETVDNFVRRNQKPPNVCFVPAGVLKYVEQRAIETPYAINGGNYSSSIVSVNGIRIESSMEFSLGSNEPQDDPAYRPRTIGGFVYMQDSHLSNVPPEEHRTCMYDKQLYSEDMDKNYMFRFKDSFWNCGVWNPNLAYQKTELLGEGVLRPYHNYYELYEKTERLNQATKKFMSCSDVIKEEFANTFGMVSEEHKLETMEDHIEETRAKPRGIKRTKSTMKRGRFHDDDDSDVEMIRGGGEFKYDGDTDDEDGVGGGSASDIARRRAYRASKRSKASVGATSTMSVSTHHVKIIALINTLFLEKAVADALINFTTSIKHDISILNDIASATTIDTFIAQCVRASLRQRGMVVASIGGGIGSGSGTVPFNVRLNNGGITLKSIFPLDRANALKLTQTELVVLDFSSMLDAETYAISTAENDPSNVMAIAAAFYGYLVYGAMNHNFGSTGDTNMSPFEFVQSNSLNAAVVASIRLMNRRILSGPSFALQHDVTIRRAHECVNELLKTDRFRNAGEANAFVQPSVLTSNVVAINPFLKGTFESRWIKKASKLGGAHRTNLTQTIESWIDEWQTVFRVDVQNNEPTNAPSYDRFRDDYLNVCKLIHGRSGIDKQKMKMVIQLADTLYDLETIHGRIRWYTASDLIFAWLNLVVNNDVDLETWECATAAEMFERNEQLIVEQADGIRKFNVDAQNQKLIKKELSLNGVDITVLLEDFKRFIGSRSDHETYLDLYALAMDNDELITTAPVVLSADERKTIFDENEDSSGFTQDILLGRFIRHAIADFVSARVELKPLVSVQTVLCVLLAIEHFTEFQTLVDAKDHTQLFPMLQPVVELFLASLNVTTANATDSLHIANALLQLLTCNAPWLVDFPHLKNPTYSTNDALYQLFINNSPDELVPRIRNTLIATKQYVSWVPATPPQVDKVTKAVLIPGSAAIVQPAESLSTTPASLIFTKEDFEHVLRINSTDSGRMFKWLMDNDIPLPLGLLGFTPHMEYIMGTMFMMLGCGAAGYTYYGRADFQLGDSVHNKMHYGHFTMYMSCVVHDHKMIIHARDIFCKRYVQGNGHRLWNALDQDDVEQYQSDEMVKDMFLVCVPMNIPFEGQFVMDIRGKFHETIAVDMSSRSDTSYPGANEYSEHWGWNANDVMNPKVTEYRPASYAPRFSTLCFQSYMGHYDHATKKYDHHEANSGHWGPRTGPGTAAGRCGKSMYIPCPNWLGVMNTVVTTSSVY